MRMVIDGGGGGREGIVGAGIENGGVYTLSSN